MRSNSLLQGTILIISVQSWCPVDDDQDRQIRAAADDGLIREREERYQAQGPIPKGTARPFQAHHLNNYSGKIVHLAFSLQKQIPLLTHLEQYWVPECEGAINLARQLNRLTDHKEITIANQGSQSNNISSFSVVREVLLANLPVNSGKLINILVDSNI